jgi:uncharacterized membrane protein
LVKRTFNDRTLMPAAVRTPASALLAFGIVPVLFHIIIVETSHVRLTLSPSFPALFKLGFVTASVLSHWGIYTSLLVLFGLTLRPGHEPLITGMARRLQGDLPPELATYTRRVTIAWCCFFATQLTLSVMLFCFAPLVVWSSFVNLFDIPLVVAMFAAEYLVRLRCLRNPPRHSFAMILKMVAEVGEQARPAAASAARPD